MNYEQFLSHKIDSLHKAKKIVLIDGDDKRTIEAALLLKKQKNIETLILVDEDPEETFGLEFLNIHSDQTKYNKYVEQYITIRKGRETKEQAEKAIKTRPFYAMMMLANDEVDGVVGGLKFTTADILRAAFRVIGPKLGVKTISSIMIMHKDDDKLIFSDISVNPKPNLEQLTDIGLNAAEVAPVLGVDPKIAFLSFSTDGSAVTDETKLVREATDLFNEKYQGTKAIGEIQFDAAVDLKVRAAKYKREYFNEPANVFVFPNLESGNIGYKLVQRLGGYGAIGPIVVGTKKPINDLSRGSSVNDVYNTVLITALQSELESEGK